MRKLLITLAITAVVGTAGFQVYGFFKSDRTAGDVSIAKDGAKSLDVDIQFGAGSLLIEGNAAEWVDGFTDTNVKKWYPSVTYKNKRNIGYVEIHQKTKSFLPFRKKRNDWDLQLTNEIPVDLNVEMGVSDAELNLAGIRLSHLSVDAGVGDTTIDLNGDWKESFKADLDFGVGDVDIMLPKNTGVTLTVSKGLGSVETRGFISQGKGVYVNEAYGQSKVVIDINADIGVGDVSFLLVE